MLRPEEMAAIEQWVNVNEGEEHEKPFSDSKLENARLGRVATIQVTFDKPLPANAKFKIVADEDPKDIYKGKELEYPRFQFDPGDAQAATADGTKVAARHVELPAMGGNGYRVEAKYHGTTKKSEKVYSARRRVYFAVVEMELHQQVADAVERERKDRAAGATEPEAPVDFSIDQGFTHLRRQLEDKPNQVFIDAYKVKNSRPGKLSHMSVDIADDADQTPLRAALKPFIRPLLQKRPCGAIVMVDRIGMKSERTFSDIFASDQFVGAKFFELGLDLLLWCNHTKAQDDAKHWLVEITAVALDSDGNPVGVPQVLPRDAIERSRYRPQQAVSINLDMCETVLSPIRETQARHVGLTWRMRYWLKEAAGAHFHGTNLIVVSRRNQVRPTASKLVLGSLVHEVGHLLGMVPDGKRPAFLREADNHHQEDSAEKHQPGHCKDKTCVMHFTNKKEKQPKKGDPGRLEEVHIRSDTFCAACKKLLRITDVSSASGVFGGNVA